MQTHARDALFELAFLDFALRLKQINPTCTLKNHEPQLKPVILLQHGAAWRLTAAHITINKQYHIYFKSYTHTNAYAELLKFIITSTTQVIEVLQNGSFETLVACEKARSQQVCPVCGVLISANKFFKPRFASTVLWIKNIHR